MDQLMNKRSETNQEACKQHVRVSLVTNVVRIRELARACVCVCFKGDAFMFAMPWRYLVTL